MKKTLVLLLILSNAAVIFAQQDSLLLKNYEKKILEISGLQREIQSEKQKSAQLSEAYKRDTVELQKTVAKLEKELSKLKKFKEQKKETETSLKQKNDSIALLKSEISKRDKQIAEEKEKGDEKAKSEYEKGRQSAFANIVDGYKKPYNDLLKSSTQQSVQRDLPVISNNEELKPVVSDLAQYFSAQRLLENKFDAIQIKIAQTHLDSIRQTSGLLDKLKGLVENYGIFNDGLKETIEKIIALDKREMVSGMSEEIKKQKFNKILSEISSYIFNYDFNFADYPYLSNIMLELLKRKQANADADIADLLKKVTS
jgi:hypothetical protein